MLLSIMSIVISLVLLCYLIYLNKIVNNLAEEQSAFIDVIEDSVSDSLAEMNSQVLLLGSQINDVAFNVICDKYDFCNFIHKTGFLVRDLDGKFHPHKYEWTMEEELRLFKVKEYIDQERERRGLSATGSNKITRLD